jgi:hypothetical protein
MNRWLGRTRLSLAFLIVALAAPAGATLVRELDFLSLNRRAAAIFHGRCQARTEHAEAKPFPYTEYVFEVLAAAKGCEGPGGKTAGTITVRHLGTRTGHVRPDGLEVPPLRAGLPEYEVGEEAVLFLTRESSLGLCAPVGLTQGKFPVTRKKEQPYVRNSAATRPLIEKVDAGSLPATTATAVEKLRSGPRELEVAEFLGACRELKE